jgi:Transcriptional regulation of mitochondrial recombination
MNARSTTDLARHAILPIGGVRYAIYTIRGARHASTAPIPPPLEYGRQIFVYNHLQKNHVVYSLTRALKVFPFSSNSCFYLTNDAANRTTNPSANYPSTAKKPSREPSAKTSGHPSQHSPSPPHPSGSQFTKNCANLGRDMS